MRKVLARDCPARFDADISDQKLSFSIAICNARRGQLGHTE